MPLRLVLRSALAAAVLSGTAAAQYRTLTVETDTAAVERVALVLGTSDYAHLPPLQTPRNDAEDMAAALNGVGFTVFVGTDLTAAETERALLDYAGELAGAEVAMVFYAGHGVDVGGANYLLPTDLGGGTEPHELRDGAVPLDRVLETLDRSGVPLKITVLDAHRGDPLGWGSGGRALPGAPRPPDGGPAAKDPAGSGWAPVQVPTGAIVAFGTAPGAMVSGGLAGRNGLFTASLLDHIATPGVEVSRAFRLAAQQVYQESDGGQQPYLTLGYLGDFYMVPGGTEPSR